MNRLPKDVAGAFISDARSRPSEENRAGQPQHPNGDQRFDGGGLRFWKDLEEGLINVLHEAPSVRLPGFAD